MKKIKTAERLARPLPVDQLRIGTFYNWTAKHGRKCQLLGIQQVFPDGGALVWVSYRSGIYYAGSNQLYLRELTKSEKE